MYFSYFQCNPISTDENLSNGLVFRVEQEDVIAAGVEPIADQEVGRSEYFCVEEWKLNKKYKY